MCKKILIIDDEPDFTFYLQDSFESEGYETSCAFDGLQGLNKAKEFQPDLVVETEPPIPEQNEIRENKTVEMPIERDQVVRQMEKFENLF